MLNDELIDNVFLTRKVGLLIPAAFETVGNGEEFVLQVVGISWDIEYGVEERFNGFEGDNCDRFVAARGGTESNSFAFWDGSNFAFDNCSSEC